MPSPTPSRPAFATDPGPIAMKTPIPALLAAVALAACAAMPAPEPQTVARAMPPTDCKAWVGTDRNVELPGYLLPQANGATQCVPLLLTAHKPPPGYRGEFYVDEFTDGKLKGDTITFTAGGTEYTGKVNGTTIEGTTKSGEKWQC